MLIYKEDRHVALTAQSAVNATCGGYARLCSARTRSTSSSGRTGGTHWALQAPHVLGAPAQEIRIYICIYIYIYIYILEFKKRRRRAIKISEEQCLCLQNRFLGGGKIVVRFVFLVLKCLEMYFRVLGVFGAIF